MNNVKLGNLLIETADLLDESSDVLTEGIMGKIGLAFVGLITFSVIYTKICDSIDYNKKKKSLNDINTYKHHIDRLIGELDKVKFVSYNPSVKNVMKKNLQVLKQSEQKLKSLDNKLFNCKTDKDFRKIEKSLTEQYKNLYNDTKNKIKENNNQISKDAKYEVDLSIIDCLKEYLNYINNAYYRNLDGDDFWEGIKFLYDIYINHDHIWLNEHEHEVNSLYNDAYKCLTTFPEYSITAINGFTEVFKYIKIQFKGKNPKENKKTQNEAVADLLTEAAYLLSLVDNDNN